MPKLRLFFGGDKERPLTKNNGSTVLRKIPLNKNNGSTVLCKFFRHDYICERERVCTVCMCVWCICVMCSVCVCGVYV